MRGAVAAYLLTEDHDDVGACASASRPATFTETETETSGAVGCLEVAAGSTEAVGGALCSSGPRLRKR